VVSERFIKLFISIQVWNVLWNWSQRRI